MVIKHGYPADNSVGIMCRSSSGTITNLRMSKRSEQMQPTIVREITRTGAEDCRGLAEQGVATVHESFGRRGLLAPRMRPISDGWSIAGPAVTSLNHPGDNLMVHAALAVCQPGDILVVATTAPCNMGLIGELIARQAQVRGLAGIVIDSAVRDVRDLRQLGLPIWSAAISAAGSVKATPGWVNVPVVCGDQLVNPGDAIVADDDGVVVVPREQAAAVLDAARARTAKEAIARERIQSGSLSWETSEFRRFLAEQGLDVP
jgi:4-hydroxy-4-methyl-2-oxoglutarate aldolase